MLTPVVRKELSLRDWPKPQEVASAVRARGVEPHGPTFNDDASTLVSRFAYQRRTRFEEWDEDHAVWRLTQRDSLKHVIDSMGEAIRARNRRRRPARPARHSRKPRVCSHRGETPSSGLSTEPRASARISHGTGST